MNRKENFMPARLPRELLILISELAYQWDLSNGISPMRSFGLLETGFCVQWSR